MGIQRNQFTSNKSKNNQEIAMMVVPVVEIPPKGKTIPTTTTEMESHRCINEKRKNENETMPSRYTTKTYYRHH